ncbi:heavy-metal-associated domain-containing protein [Achromobacter xylosoxidans]
MSIEFQVLDMTCGHCVKTITGAVTAAAPGASVAVDLPTHRVTVNGTDQADKVEAAIRDAGYEPQRV